MAPVFELEITLLESKHRIWRRLQTASNATFYELHYMLQFAMGWTNSHLHQFIVGDREEFICPPWEDIWEDEEVTNSKEVTIADRLTEPGDKIVYEYDFGDGWTHLVELVQILNPDAKQKYPVVMAGLGACPPEDCGGMGGYADILERFNKPGTEGQDELLEWLGEDFDPQHFDTMGVNMEFFRNFKRVMKQWDDYAMQ